MVFVDYEYWYYSCQNKYNILPDTAALRMELEDHYDIAEIRVFADFLSPGIAKEKAKIELLADHIINTEGESCYRRKDLTDFVMLDSIYQCAMYEKNIGTYILLTGDGHFTSVVKYLVEQRHKKVIIYGVNDTISRRLQDIATDVITLPHSAELKAAYRAMIIENLAYVADKNIVPTFRGTVDAVAKRYDIPANDIEIILAEMIDDGYVVKKDYAVEFKKYIKIVAPDWEKLIADGYWNPEKQSVTNRI